MKTILQTTVLSVVALFGISQVLAGMHESSADVANLKRYYLNTEADLSRYNKVYVDSLKVFDARIVAPDWYVDAKRGPRKWQLTEKDIEFLRTSYREAMVDEIQEKGGYPVVKEFADDVIILDVEIVTLTPYALPGEEVQVRGFGELLAQATLRDGVTSELLGIFEGPQDVSPEYQQNTRLNTEKNLRALFQVWGARMRQVMDDNRK